jgi:hypothetical protein
MEQYLNFLNAVKIGALVAVASLTYIIIFSAISTLISLYKAYALGKHMARSVKNPEDLFTLYSSDRKDH